MSNHPPKTLDGAEVIKYCIFDERISATGNHSITIDEKPFLPSAAAICRYKGDNKFYVFYCDDKWEVIGDMDEDSLEEAINSMEHSYEGAKKNLQAPKL